MYKRDKRLIKALRAEVKSYKHQRDMALEEIDTTRKLWLKSNNNLFAQISRMDDRLRRIAPYIYGMDDPMYNCNPAVLQDALKNHGITRIHVPTLSSDVNAAAFSDACACAVSDVFSMHTKMIHLLEARVTKGVNFHTGEDSYTLRVRIGSELEYCYGYSDEFMAKFGYDTYDLSEVITKAIIKQHKSERDAER